MKKKNKRIFSFLMAIVMIVTVFPFTGLQLSASAYNTGDDYPSKYKNAALGTIIDEWNFYNRYCTSYVAWCLSSRNGLSDFSNWYGGAHFGDAGSWVSAAQSIGLTVNQTPAVGSVACWNNSGRGHVAWVKQVNSDGTAVTDEYNWNSDGAYHTRTVSAPYYIHFKDITNGDLSEKLPKPPRTNPPTLIKEFSYNGRIYRAYASTLTWWQSKQWCENNSGHLATITQPCDQVAVNTFVNKYDNLYLFLGAECESTGSWRWIDGTPLSYTYWGAGQPDGNGGTEKFLGTYKNGTWNDFDNGGSGAIWGFLYEKDTSNATNTVSSSLPGVKYSGTKKNGDSFSEFKDAATMGTAGDSMFSNLGFKLYNCSGGISYSVHLSDDGWTSYVSNGTLAGTSGQSTAIEAIRIKLTGEAANKYNIYYRTYVNGKGWYEWTSDDKISGTTGAGLHVSAVQALLVPRVKYSAHVAGVGWTSEVSDGTTAGTTGQTKQCEGMYAKLADANFGDIKYMAHIANVGWGINEEIYNGRWAGSTGLELQMEAFKVYLTGEAANRFDVFYRAHCKNNGWTGWVTNGTAAGTTGQDLQLEAFEIEVRPRGSSMSGEGGHEYATGSLGTKSLTFNANGGTYEYTTVPPCANSEYILPGSVPVKEGYNFAGWYTNSSLTGKQYMPYDYIKMDSDYTLYAKWERKSYTVTFNANGGSCSTSNKTVTQNSTYGTLPTPTKTGYTFDGWYTSATGGNKITSSTNVTITSNQTLYAHWISVHTHNYNVAVTKAATCTETGLMKYTCSCGNTYTKTIPATGHSFGEWETIEPVTIENDGTKQHTCSRCGTVETDIIPSLGIVKLILPETVEMSYKSKLYIDRQVINRGHLSYSVIWTSSNPDIADVDSYGNITALRAGKTVITCTVTSENGKTFEDSCTVTVKYNLAQWILNIFMFGWLWY